MEITQHVNPSTKGVNRDADGLRQVAINKLVSRPIGKEPHKHLELVDLLDLRQVTDVLSDQLFEA